MIKDIRLMTKVLQNTIKDIHNTIKDIQNMAKDIHNTIKDIQNTAKDVQNIIKDIQNTIKDVQNTIKVDQNIIKDIQNTIKTVHNTMIVVKIIHAFDVMFVSEMIFCIILVNFITMINKKMIMTQRILRMNERKNVNNINRIRYDF
jgi:uncharacterized phage infection (PIP) family protein YhgE